MCVSKYKLILPLVKYWKFILSSIFSCIHIFTTFPLRNLGRASIAPPIVANVTPSYNSLSSSPLALLIEICISSSKVLGNLPPFILFAVIVSAVSSPSTEKLVPITSLPFIVAPVILPCMAAFLQLIDPSLLITKLLFAVTSPSMTVSPVILI